MFSYTMPENMPSTVIFTFVMLRCSFLPFGSVSSTDLIRLRPSACMPLACDSFASSIS